jgi:hypothetical protein
MAHPPGNGAVHGPGIEVEETDPIGKSAGDGAFAGSCGTVDGNDGRAIHQEDVIDQTAGAATYGCGKNAQTLERLAEAAGSGHQQVARNQWQGQPSCIA